MRRRFSFTVSNTRCGLKAAPINAAIAEPDVATDSLSPLLRSMLYLPVQRSVDREQLILTFSTQHKAAGACAQGAGGKGGDAGPERPVPVVAHAPLGPRQPLVGGLSAHHMFVSSRGIDNV
jgi:hypothetical protein